MASRIIRALMHPRDLILYVITSLKLGRSLSDERYLRLIYRIMLGKRLSLDNPITFSEKLQWLKLYYRKSNFSTMVDKYAVKEYVAERIGEKYIIPTLGLWDKPEDIDWDSLPNSFVLKTTQGGGNIGVVICKNKAELDRGKVIAKLSKSLKQDLYLSLREWPYRDVPRRILAEKYIEPAPNEIDLPDYKWYCFGGEPTFCQVIQGRNANETIDFFDSEWKHQEFVGLNPATGPAPGPAPLPPARPSNLETQLWIARKLSNGIPFCRIDLYQAESDTFFGEITLFPKSGLGVFIPDRYNLILGEMLKLPEKKVLE